MRISNLDYFDLDSLKPVATLYLMWIYRFFDKMFVTKSAILKTFIKIYKNSIFDIKSYLFTQKDHNQDVGM